MLSNLQHADDFSTKAPADDPFWNESAWFSLSVPERHIHGFVYYFFRPNINMLVGGPALWDESGAYSWNCLHYDWPYFQAIPEGATKFGFTAPNSLKVELLEPLTRYKLDYDRLGVKLDLTWTATSKPADTCAMEEAATGASPKNRLHLEQCGRMTGTITLHGEEIPVDCFSLRDASHGSRNMVNVVKGSYFWGIASETSAFHAMVIGDGAEQKVTGGFLMRDGEMAALVGGKRHILREGPHTPAEFLFDCEDTLGRTLSVRGHSSSELLFTGYPDVSIIWSLLRFDDYEGGTGWGDMQEFNPPATFRQRTRALQAA